MTVLKDYKISYKIIPRNTGHEIRFTAIPNDGGDHINEVIGINNTKVNETEINDLISSAIDRYIAIASEEKEGLRNADISTNR